MGVGGASAAVSVGDRSVVLYALVGTVVPLPALPRPCLVPCFPLVFLSPPPACSVGVSALPLHVVCTFLLMKSRVPPCVKGSHLQTLCNVWRTFVRFEQPVSSCVFGYRGRSTGINSHYLPCSTLRIQARGFCGVHVRGLPGSGLSREIAFCHF